MTYIKTKYGLVPDYESFFEEFAEEYFFDWGKLYGEQAYSDWKKLGAIAGRPDLPEFELLTGDLYDAFYEFVMHTEPYRSEFNSAVEDRYNDYIESRGE